MICSAARSFIDLCKYINMTFAAANYTIYTPSLSGFLAACGGSEGSKGKNMGSTSAA